jgi:hypothetical protein
MSSFSRSKAGSFIRRSPRFSPGSWSHLLFGILEHSTDVIEYGRMFRPSEKSPVKLARSSSSSIVPV